MARRLLLVFLFFVLAHCGYSQTVAPVVIKDADASYSITSGIEYIEDPRHELTANSILAATNYKVWKEGIPNFGAVTTLYWVRLKVRNETNDSNLTLKVSDPTLDSLTFYEPLSNGQVRVINTGEAMLFEQREINSSDFQFSITIPQNSEKYLYLRVSSSDPLLLPVTVGTASAMADADKLKDLFWGMYMGLMLAMLLYNCFVYITTRDSSYLYYIVYVLAVVVTQITISGYGFQLLWPGNAWVAEASAFLTPPLVGIAGMEFMRHFLRTKFFVPRADKGFFLLYALYGVAVVAAFARKFSVTFNLIDLTASLVSIYMLIIAIVIYRKGYRPAGFFLISWIAFLVGVFIFVFKNFNILPYNNFTVYTMPVGSAMEVILLSFALADRINILKKEKEEHQAQAIGALEENARIIRDQNVLLENKVNERTHELNLTNQDLTKALTDLKEAETQLVESEKMASLGQLTAGIAHEINNPINFVTSNVKPLNRDVLILLDAIKEIELVALSESSANEKNNKIKSYKDEIDFDYLKEEIEMLLKGIGEGASRTEEIVKGLRIFSRLDEDDLKKADINEGLDSTLIIANNLIGSNIKVEKKYSGLPLIECYPGKLNQVFLNIIGNGAYAVKKKFGDNEGGIITISTKNDDNYVYITISDNGTGMDEGTKRRLFEPFFTTKDVGEGTGLGMSIAYNTISKHNGTISVNSELGKGSEFVIKFPLIQK